jgi:hypothetical protein
MVNDTDRQLLTAYVDGQLSTRQQKQVLRLLQSSEEARRLLCRLQEDSRGVRELPRVRPRRDLAPIVVRKIHERGLRPRRRCPEPVHQPFPFWSSFAAAAAVLLVLMGISAYVSLILNPSPFGNTVVVEQGPEKHVPEDGTLPPVPPKRTENPGTATPFGPDRPEVPGSGNPPPVAVVPAPGAAEPGEGTDPVPLPPEGAVAEGPVLAGPGSDMEIFNPETVKVVLPQVFSVGALDGSEDQLGQSEGFRLELLCANASRAYQWVRESLRKGHVQVVVEPAAAWRLKQPRLPTSYALYLEGITREALLEMLARVGAKHMEEVKNTPQNCRLYGRLVVAPLNGLDRKELVALLAVDPTQDKSFKPGAKPGKPQALVLAYQPLGARAPSFSNEIKKFLKNRRPLPKDTLRVLLVLRTVRPLQLPPR